MTWTSPMTFSANSALTASQLNTHLRDNFNETEVAKGITPGAWLVSTSSTNIEERLHKSGYRQALAGTTSSTYTDTLSAGQEGPSVSVVTGTEAIVMISCQLSNQVSQLSCQMSYKVQGATNVSVSSAWGINHDRETTGSETLMRIHHHEGLNPGTNEFIAMYQAGGSASKAQFQCRRIQVIPF